ncbi:unnamed protein product [Polarella glacialis]|uniref:Aminoglycoside phosphotransferase domain-containing protein n=1 Tax=Polarella glacialis TaxID=89957 RepID=A0A813D6K5_POLGL|nr:unnamed protein product [Polarella glacialis]
MAAAASGLNVPHPPLHRKVGFLAWECVYQHWLLLSWGLPVAVDALLVRIWPEHRRLPSCTDDLLDPSVYSRLVGCGPVEAVTAPHQAEQHALSTDRKSLLVSRGGQEERIFAKTPATNRLVASMLLTFDVYRNEVHRYTDIELPVLTPRVLCARQSPSQFVLVLEDLSAMPDVQMLSLWKNECSLELGKKILSAYAKLHARFLGSPPKGVWDDSQRPYMSAAAGLATWYRVTRYVCPGAASEHVVRLFTAALWHWSALRTAWSAAAPQTLVHGDAHIGNIYLQGSEVGFFDFQVVGSEHPMRDVTYFLASSYPKENLARDEAVLLSHYRESLEQELVACGSVQRAPSAEECWQQYRIQIFYAMYAFVFCGGIGGGLQDAYQTRILVERVASVMERVDAAGALRELVGAKDHAQ